MNIGGYTQSCSKAYNEEGKWAKGQDFCELGIGTVKEELIKPNALSVKWKRLKNTSFRSNNEEQRQRPHS